MTNSASCRVTWKNLGGLSGSELVLGGLARQTLADSVLPRQADVLETVNFGGDAFCSKNGAVTGPYCYGQAVGRALRGAPPYVGAPGGAVLPF